MYRPLTHSYTNIKSNQLGPKVILMQKCIDRLIHHQLNYWCLVCNVKIQDISTILINRTKNITSTHTIYNTFLCPKFSFYFQDKEFALIPSDSSSFGDFVL